METLEVLEKLRSLVPIESLAAKYTTLKKTGTNFKGRCPFHAETVPSFVVNPTKGICFCFGCQKGGDVFKLVQFAEKTTFGEAVHSLAERYEINIDEREFEDDEKTLFNLREEGYDEHARLISSENTARNYLLERGLSKDDIYIFNLGCNKDYRRIVFPLANSFGRTVGFTRRLIEGEGAKYMNSRNSATYDKSKILYGLYQAKEAIRKEDFVVLVEGQFDVISSHRVGVKNCIGLSGTTLSDTQRQILKQHTKNFVLALDGDRAGINASVKIGTSLEQVGCKVSYVHFGEDQDPDQFIREKGAHAWKKLINE